MNAADGSTRDPHRSHLGATGRWAATLGIAVLLTGCGGSADVATVQPASDGPTAGDGGGGGAEVRDEFDDCMHRFDDVAIDADRTWDHWRKRGAQPTWRAVSDAIDKRYRFFDPRDEGDDPKSAADRALPNGYIDALFDSPRDRIVVVVDQNLIDRDDLEDALQRVADRVQEKKPVRDGRIDVEVLASCVPAARLAEIRSELRRDHRELDYSGGSGPRIDGRFQAYSRTAAGKRKIERRYGDLVEVDKGGLAPG